MNKAQSTPPSRHAAHDRRFLHRWATNRHVFPLHLVYMHTAIPSDVLALMLCDFIHRFRPLPPDTTHRIYLSLHSLRDLSNTTTSFRHILPASTDQSSPRQLGNTTTSCPVRPSASSAANFSFALLELPSTITHVPLRPCPACHAATITTSYTCISL